MKIKDISEFLGLKHSDHPPYIFEGVLSSGRFEGVHDYSVGLLKVSLSLDNNNFPRFIISTVDDGVWVADGSKVIDVEAFVDDFNNRFKTKLPSEAVLNDFLLNYGMYGCFTG
jgi:hypothetical protein